MKALVVDDDVITRIVLQEILSGYAEVYTCVDGMEAVLEFKKSLELGEPFDLVCMDLLMPVMGGMEALAVMRQEEKAHGRLGPMACKVVIATASEDEHNISRAFDGLCDAYIVKPIDTEEFTNVVSCLFPLPSCD